MFDDPQQLRVLLPHDLVKLRGLHSGLLHLLEGLAGIYSLMLAGVTDEENAVLWADLLHETLHLPGAGEAGFIDHVEVSPVGIAFGLLLASAHKEAL
jgi:hypothetical protein